MIGSPISGCAPTVRGRLEQLLGDVGRQCVLRYVLGQRGALAVALEIRTEAPDLELDAVAEIRRARRPLRCPTLPNGRVNLHSG